MTDRGLGGAACVALLCLASSLGAQDVVITELMATNNNTLRDQDGDFTDWAELFNASDTDIDLDGWFLTDDAFDLIKWRLPAVTLRANRFLVVFCSGKDRRDPSRELHTNFELNRAGEFLALVRPDGATIEWSFLSYPPQIDNFSYGLSQNGNFLSLINEGDAARTLIPSGNIGTSWTATGFDDSGWISGTTGVGYDENPTYGPIIETNVEPVMNNVNTSCYIRVPFDIVGADDINGFVFRMKYDDGFAAYLNGTLVATRNAPSTLEWDSQATALHDDGAAVAFEEIGFSEGIPTLVEGTNVLAIHGLNDNIGSSDFVISPELDGFTSGELDVETEQFFPQATPGFGNLNGFPGVSERPSVSPESQVFVGNLQVVLEVPDGQTEIRYTNDGSEPNESSSLYTAPININSSTLIRAKGFRDGFAPSPTVSQGYIGIDSSLQNRSSDVPLILVDTFGGGIPSSGWQPAFMAIFETGGLRSQLSELPDLQTRIGIRTRGSSTGGRSKASYNLEAWDEFDEDKDIAPLGLPEEADWILYGAYNFDRAHIRNPFIYQLSNDIGRYAVRTVHCELFVNRGGGSIDTGDYAGVYSFCEKIKRGADRVDVEKLTADITSAPEISGGYMLKIDRLDPGDSGVSAGGRTLGWVYPKEERVIPEQETWIRNYINTMASSLSGNNYDQYIDAAAWADHHFLNVLTKNADALRLSTYMFKGRNDLFEFGPIWDFDRSMDSTDSRDNSPTGWAGGTDYFNYPWWKSLFENSNRNFAQLWIDRWQMFRATSMSDSSIVTIIERMRTTLAESAPRDALRWNQTTPTGWSGEVDHVRDWLLERTNWIDSRMVSRPFVGRGSGMVSPGTQVTMSSSGGDIYYTLDGTDPRRPGGGIDPTAEEYTGTPLVIDDNTRLIARNRAPSVVDPELNTNWSGPVDVTYVVNMPTLVITELMYHPPDPLPSSQFGDEDFEFVEFLNIGSEALDLTGFSLEDGIRFTFPDVGTLDPGDYIVAVRNLAAFQERYGTDVRVAGEYDGNLSNSTERIRLYGPLREPILNFAYDDGWYPDTDGTGPSIVVVAPDAARSSWNLQESWLPSSVLGGSPGGPDDGFPPLGGRQVPGDSNQDGYLEISDALSLLRRVTGDLSTLPCEGGSLQEGGNFAVFNLNGDLSVDLSDIVFLLNYIFMSGLEPVLGGACLRIEGCPSVCSF